MTNLNDVSGLTKPLDQLVCTDEMKYKSFYLTADCWGLSITHNLRNCSNVVICKLSPLNLNIKEIILNFPVWEPDRWKELQPWLPAWLVEYVNNELYQ
jgi:hypothetical protein